jgi:hypothetical protein
MSHFESFFRVSFTPNSDSVPNPPTRVYGNIHDTAGKRAEQADNTVHKKAAMNHSRPGSPRMSTSSRPRFATTALLIMAFGILFAQTGGQAAPGDALPYARGYSGTINYVVGSVDLTEQANPIDQYGFSTGTISITGVPDDADIVAAYLYWETITLDADPSQAAGVKFRDHELLLNDVMAVKKSSQALTGSTASCWSSGVPLRMTLFRADVLPLLPVRVDKDGKPTGKRIVNSDDLTRRGLQPHKVYLPMSPGNQVPESAGASLVIVYSHQTEAFRKVVFYDGIFIQPDTTTPMTQTLRGFYKSASAKSAKITHILGSGQPNGNERVYFNDSNSPTMTKISPADPVVGGSASQRGWSALTYDVSNLMNPGANSSGGYGETATTKLDHAPGGGYDCLAWGSVIFSTAMADDDPNGDPGIVNGPKGDGIPDGLEDAAGGLKNPDDTQLPDLKGMGAGSGQRDLFVEVNGMWAPADTYYGDATAPYSSTITTFPDPTAPYPYPNGHVHLPTPEDFKRVGLAYAAHGIKAHFDVGNLDTYHGHGIVPHADWIDDYTSTDADQYLVGSAYARGGEVIRERACDPLNPSCQFPAYPGTVGWKLGLQIYRDAPVGDNGEELDFTDPAVVSAWEAGTQHRRRLDRARFGLFHYALYAHARGTPKSQPCLVFGEPGPYDVNNGTTCTTNNPDFDPLQYHVPTSASGVADLPGGNLLVTLGLWDELVGRPFVRASTTFHELGHNLYLWHGGKAAIFGDDAPLAPALPTSTYIEPNCKPNYQSSMSYMFQIHGLFDDSDIAHLDYSGTAIADINKTADLTDGQLLNPAPYRFAWYAPSSSPLALSLGVSKSSRYCSGRPFTPNPDPFMARVYTTTVAAPIDWNGDTFQNVSGAQDVNLDGTSNSPLLGFNDWSSIRLNQIGAGRKVVKFQAELVSGTGYGDTIDFGSGDTVDFGSGDTIDFGSGDTIDFGSGDTIDFGSGLFFDQSSGDVIDFGSGDTVDFGSGDTVDFGSGDTVDFGSGDTVDFGSGTPRQEVDYDGARGLGRAVPYGLAACAIGTTAQCNVTPTVGSGTPFYHRNLVRWNASTVGHVAAYLIQRKRAGADDTTYTQIGTSTTNYFIDPEELPDGVLNPTLAFTYRVRAQFDDNDPSSVSGWSQPVTISAVNNPPVGAADSYTMLNNTTLTAPAPGVLGNDADVDSPSAFIGRRVVITSPAGGTTSGDFITVMTANLGTLVMNTSTGGFTYTPKGGFVGTDSFQYYSNDGLWGATAIPLSGNSGTVTVTIRVTKK